MENNQSILTKQNSWFLFGSLLFLFVVWVGFNPFPYAKIGALDVGETGSGNTMRQVIFLGIALIFALNISKEIRLNLFKILSWPILSVIIWCAISISWSAVPFIASRRLMLLAVVIFIVFCMVLYLKPKNMVVLLAWFLLLLIVVSDVTGPIIPGARHNANDFGAAELIGNWRGIFTHKNSAGAAAAFTIILSIYMYQTTQKKLWLGGILASIVLLVFAVSKTSMGLMVPALAAGFIYRGFTANHTSRYIFKYLVMLFFLAVVGAIYFFRSAILAITDDPMAFTGRSQIWDALGNVISERPIFGWGYQSIWDVNVATPLLRYSDNWILLMPHGHNGYLDIWASTGLIGLFLTVFAFIIYPILKIVETPQIPSPLGAMLISLVVFISLHNLTETSLLFSAEPRWITLLMIYAIVQYYHQNISPVSPELKDSGPQTKASNKIRKFPVKMARHKNL